LLYILDRVEIFFHYEILMIGPLLTS